MESKWIIFEWDSSTQSKKTKVWRVIAKGSNLVLGKIGWYGAWRGYAFFPFSNCLFETQCLRDIASFIEEQNKLQRQTWRKK